MQRGGDGSSDASMSGFDEPVDAFVWGSRLEAYGHRLTSYGSPRPLNASHLASLLPQIGNRLTLLQH